MKRLLLLSTLLVGCGTHSPTICYELPPNCDPTKPWTCECHDDIDGENTLSFSPPTNEPSTPPDDRGGQSDPDNSVPSDSVNGGPTDPDNGGSSEDNGGKTKDDNGHGNDPGKHDPSNPGKKKFT